MKGIEAVGSLATAGNSPCAGITLIRFGGYDLSLPLRGKHPGTAGKFIGVFSG